MSLFLTLFLNALILFLLLSVYAFAFVWVFSNTRVIGFVSELFKFVPKPSERKCCCFSPETHNLVSTLFSSHLSALPGFFLNVPRSRSLWMCIFFGCSVHGKSSSKCKNVIVTFAPGWKPGRNCDQCDQVHLTSRQSWSNDSIAFVLYTFLLIFTTWIPSRDCLLSVMHVRTKFQWSALPIDRGNPRVGNSLKTSSPFNCVELNILAMWKGRKRRACVLPLTLKVRRVPTLVDPRLLSFLPRFFFRKNRKEGNTFRNYKWNRMRFIKLGKI